MRQLLRQTIEGRRSKRRKKTEPDQIDPEEFFELPRPENDEEYEASMEGGRAMARLMEVMDLYGHIRGYAGYGEVPQPPAVEHAGRKIEAAENPREAKKLNLEIGRAIEVGTWFTEKIVKVVEDHIPAAFQKNQEAPANGAEGQPPVAEGATETPAPDGRRAAGIDWQAATAELVFGKRLYGEMIRAGDYDNPEKSQNTKQLGEVWTLVRRIGRGLRAPLNWAKIGWVTMNKRMELSRDNAKIMLDAAIQAAQEEEGEFLIAQVAESARFYESALSDEKLTSQQRAEILEKMATELIAAMQRWDDYLVKQYVDQEVVRGIGQGQFSLKRLSRFAGRILDMSLIDEIYDHVAPGNDNTRDIVKAYERHTPSAYASLEITALEELARETMKARQIDFARKAAEKEYDAASAEPGADVAEPPMPAREGETASPRARRESPPQFMDIGISIREWLKAKGLERLEFGSIEELETEVLEEITRRMSAHVQKSLAISLDATLMSSGREVITPDSSTYFRHAQYRTLQRAYYDLLRDIVLREITDPEQLRGVENNPEVVRGALESILEVQRGRLRTMETDRLTRLKRSLLRKGAGVMGYLTLLSTGAPLTAAGAGWAIGKVVVMRAATIGVGRRLIDLIGLTGRPAGGAINADRPEQPSGESSGTETTPPEEGEEGDPANDPELAQAAEEVEAFMSHAGDIMDSILSRRVSLEDGWGEIEGSYRRLGDRARGLAQVVLAGEARVSAGASDEATLAGLRKRLEEELARSQTP
ncbi:MAG: hypothetical protein V1826_01800 [bacterium]